MLLSFRRAQLHCIFNLLLTLCKPLNKSVARVSLRKGFQVYPLHLHLPRAFLLLTSTGHISYLVHLN